MIVKDNDEKGFYVTWDKGNKRYYCNPNDSKDLENTINKVNKLFNIKPVKDAVKEDIKPIKKSTKKDKWEYHSDNG